MDDIYPPEAKFDETTPMTSVHVNNIEVGISGPLKPQVWEGTEECIDSEEEAGVKTRFVAPSDTVIEEEEEDQQSFVTDEELISSNPFCCSL
jgi:hypothetical protein